MMSTVSTLTSSYDAEGHLHSAFGAHETLLVATVAFARRRLRLKKGVVLPAAHAQKNLPQQRQVVKMFGVDGGLACRTKRNLVGRNVIQNVENGQSPPSGQGAAEVLHRASGLELASRNHVDDETDLGLEYTARYALEQNFGL